MKRLYAFLFFPFLFLPQRCQAEPTKTVFNPFTGRLDFITKIDSNTILAGSNCTVTSNAGGTVTITCPAGSGGASSLGVGTGTASGFSGVITSSPTGTFLGNSLDMQSQLLTGTTVLMSLANTINSTHTWTASQTLTGGQTVNSSSITIDNTAAALTGNYNLILGNSGGCQMKQGYNTGASAHNFISTSCGTLGFSASNNGYLDELAISNNGGNFNDSFSVAGKVLAGDTHTNSNTNKLDVIGAAAIGGAYNGAAAPVNGLLLYGSEIDQGSMTVTGSTGVWVTYGLNAGSVTVNGSGGGVVNLLEGTTNVSASANYDILFASSNPHAMAIINNQGTSGLVVLSTSVPTVGHLASWSGSNQLVDGGTGGGGGGGSAFSLAITTGGPNSFGGPAISSSSATTEILFDSATTNGALTTGNTYFFTLNPSSVTLQGTLPTKLGTVTVGTWSATRLVAGEIPTDVAYNDLENNWSHAQTSASSWTITSNAGENITYNVNVGSITGGGLATCGDATHALGYNASSLFTCQSIPEVGAAGVTGNIQFNNANAFAGATFANYTASSTVISNEVILPSTMPVIVGASVQTSSAAQVEVVGSVNNANILVLATSTVGNPLVYVSTTPATKSTDFVLLVASSNYPSTSLLGVQLNGHLISSGTTPSAGVCGTNPAVDNNSTDFAGFITAGTGVPTACNIIFASPFTVAPNCVVSDNSATVTVDNYSVSTTSFTVQMSAGLSSVKIYWICIGGKGG